MDHLGPGSGGVSVWLTKGLGNDSSFAPTSPVFRELRPPMVLSSYRACFSDFSCFVEQRSCQKCLVQRSSRLATVGTFPLEAQVLKLEWDQAASYPACQDFDSARCSIGIDQEERARPIYQRALKGPGASTSARRSKVQRVKMG